MVAPKGSFKANLSLIIKNIIIKFLYSAYLYTFSNAIIFKISGQRTTLRGLQGTLILKYRDETKTEM